MNRLKRRRRRLALVGLLLLMIGSVVLLQLRIAPTLRRIAENQVVNAASDAIFRAVARQLQTGSVDYSRIIGLEKDETGGYYVCRTAGTLREYVSVSVLARRDGLALVTAEGLRDGSRVLLFPEETGG